MLEIVCVSMLILLLWLGKCGMMILCVCFNCMWMAVIVSFCNGCIIVFVRNSDRVIDRNNVLSVIIVS